MSGIERILIIAFGLMVLVVELLNTAVEEAVNRVSDDEHPLAKRSGMRAVQPLPLLH